MDMSVAANGVVTCEFCHSVFTVAKSKDETAISFIKIGEHDLDTCKFSDAFEAYNKASEIDNKESEAYFGMALATHKVQYIKDIVNNRLQPICHEINDRTFTENENYIKAIKYATNEQRNEYIRKGNEIDYISKEFESIKNKGINYDCFICVKVTDDKTKQRTSDYKIADDLYFHLRGKGYRPFFSEREIQNRTGADYEAMILYALYTSECMLIVCGDEAYLNTAWVKNEYTRFAAMIADERKENDAITIVFDGKPIEKLPNRQGKIQGINIRDITATDKITDYVYSHTPEAKERKEQAEQQRKAEEERIKQQLAEQAELQAKQLEEFKRQQAEAQRELESKLAALRNSNTVIEPSQTSGANTQSLLRRAEQFMSMGDFDNAKNYCNRVLDIDPENGDAWFLQFLADNGAKSEREFIDNCKASEDINKIKRDLQFCQVGIYASERTRNLEECLNEKASLLKVQEEERSRLEKMRKNFLIKDGMLKQYVGNDNEVVIPNDITAVCSHAFENCNNLKSVVMPTGIVNIGEYAFSNCKNLTDIKLSGSVTEIADGLFMGCKRLKQISTPNNIKRIGKDAFRDCLSMNNLVVPDRVKEIGDSAFENCKSLISINLPIGIEKINKSAFSGCTKLSDLIIPRHVAIIGDSAFYECNGLTSIVIPSNVKVIEEWAFMDCNKLKSVTISNGVTNINHHAFTDCRALISLVIPDSVIHIGERAFDGCSRLKDVNISVSTKDIGKNAFTYCDNLQNITIPKKFKWHMGKIFGKSHKNAKVTFI